MILALALLIGVLVAVAVYLLLHSDSVDKALGLVVLAHAGNLTVFASGRLMRAASPLLGEKATELTDPLPQALVLTAIVISFGLTAFAVVLVARKDRDEETRADRASEDRA